MVTDGISKNMVLLGLTLNDENKSRNGLKFARVGITKAVEEVGNMVSIDEVTTSRTLKKGPSVYKAV
jgi:hypothetical protein